MQNNQMKSKNESPSLCKRIGNYIITPPLIEQYEKEQWLKEDAQCQGEVQRRESSSNQDMIVQCWSDQELKSYKKDNKDSLRKFFQRLLSEYIGTFILVLCFTSMRVEFKLNRLSVVENALGQGLIVVALVYALGGISGAHLNPVVTFVFTVRGTFPLVWLPFYNIIQLTAALTAGGVLRALYRENAIYGANSIDLTILSSHLLGFGWETIISFFLQFIVLQTATRGRIIGPLAALAVGSINILNAIVGNINSSSMNPTRTLGPAIVNSSQDNRASLWVYIAGPYLGGVIALVFVALLNWGNSSKDDKNNEMEMAQGENK